MHAMRELGLVSTFHAQPIVESIDMSTSHPQHVLVASVDVDIRDMFWSQENETPHPYVDNRDGACYPPRVLIKHINEGDNNGVRSQH